MCMCLNFMLQFLLLTLREDSMSDDSVLRGVVFLHVQSGREGMDVGVFAHASPHSIGEPLFPGSHSSHVDCWRSGFLYPGCARVSSAPLDVNV